MRHITTTDEAAELAMLIMGARSRPLVVISLLGSDDNEGAFDAAYIADELRGDADVFTILNGPATHALQDALPHKGQVFGQAARSYPPDFGEHGDWTRSVLRFPEKHADLTLIDDAVAQITTMNEISSPIRREWVRGIVKRVSGAVGNVALLDDGSSVNIIADLLPANLTLPDALVVGKHVEGWLSERDLAPEAAEPDLSHLVEGALTLARVVKTTERRATLQLHPMLDEVVLRRRDVFADADECDEEDQLVSEAVQVGQTVRVKVTQPPPALTLSLVDVDPEAALADPLTLLKGGPPWLREGIHASAPRAESETPVESSQTKSASPAAATATSVPPPVSAPQPESSVGPELGQLRDEVAGLRASISRLSTELRAGTDLEKLDQLRDETVSLSAELHRERGLRKEYNEMINRLKLELREARQSRSGSMSSSVATQRNDWPNAESWVRHEITSAWAMRIGGTEKLRYPMPEFTVGAELATSLEKLNETQFSKAMRASVDVLTGRAAEIPSRDLHRLRQGAGGDDPFIDRPDGAKCWRVSIESGSPSARRLHYWQLPGGRIELSRIVLHDDFAP